MAEKSLQIDLTTFGANDVPLSEPTGRMLAECASVCLDHNGHGIVVSMPVTGIINVPVSVRRGEVTEVIKRTHRDLQHAQEHGAYAIGISLITQHTGLSGVEQSAKSTGIDYYVGEDDGLMFQQKARLEVSSILYKNDAEFARRTKKKLKQTERSASSGLPAFTAVVEYDAPKTHLDEHK